MTNPIEDAVAPLKADAIARAEQEAGKAIELVRSQLEESGWDINIAAPYPNTRQMGREEAERAKSRYNFFHSLTTYAEGFRYTGIPDRPHLVQMEAERCERFVRISKEDAAAQYDLFVMKLVSKIGAVEKAELTGNHVWGFSILTITKTDGITERWQTQQIVNVSKLGKLFNQWPTRKIK